MNYWRISEQSDLLTKIINCLWWFQGPKLIFTPQVLLSFWTHSDSCGITGLKDLCSPELATPGTLLLNYFCGTRVSSDNI